ncbi:GNAT family N-acetyltransferase [Methylomicrobium agile]|uniref:GNAT family N-acetyltransferase n=1 Tax=Methylomicrobium agile TaxID=39774 RepID=UPI0004DF855F|nr:GNAT family N-acetyltransferase [Methylomicrobium agile]
MKKFELLEPERHDRKSFDCGVPALNLYLQRFANQDQKRGLSRVYVLSEGRHIIGYYTISADSVVTDALPDKEKFGAYAKAPFLLLGRLAVDKRFQSRGYGDALIFHAFKTTAEAAEKVGILGIVVEAKDDRAVSYYEKFGFIRLIVTPNLLVLPFSAMKPLL